jgi:hypothetical protein
MKVNDMAPVEMNSEWLPAELGRLSRELTSRHGFGSEAADELSTIVGAVLLNDWDPSHWDIEPPSFSGNGAWQLLGTGGGAYCAKGAIIRCAESTKKRNTLTLRSGLNVMGDHLEKCQRITQTGVMLTDIYRPTDFKWNEYSLRTAQQRGQYVITILKTAKTLNVMPCPWN